MVNLTGKYFLFFFLAGSVVACNNKEMTISSHGAVIRGDTTEKRIALVFTGDEFGDGGDFIANCLKEQSVAGSFFLTGNFYRNADFAPVIRKLKKYGNYLGS